LHLRVALGTQHGQHERAVGLCGRDHDRSRRVGRVPDLERAHGTHDLDPVTQQQIDQSPGRNLVVLARRHDKGEGGLGGPALDRVARHQVHVAEDVAAVLGDRLEIGPGRHQLVLDDVTQAPPAAAPGRWEVGATLVPRKALAATAKLARIDVDRRRLPGARDLGQEAGDVLPPGGVARSARPVAVEDHVVADAPLAGLLEAARHVGTDHVGLAEDQ